MEKVKKKFTKWVFIISILFSAIIAGSLYLFMSIFVSTNVYYKVVGDSISLYKSSEYPMTVNYYDYSSVDNTFVSLSSDPQIIFDNVNFTTESILMNFSKPFEVETTLVVFYSNETYGFSEYTRIDLNIPKGSSQFYIDTSTLNLKSIRFDLMGDFTLDSIILSNQDMLVQKDMVFILFRVALLFFISFCSIMILCFFSQCRGGLFEIKEKGYKKILKELMPSYILLFIFGFMLLLFEPMLMYAVNINDFWFDFDILIRTIFIIFGIFVLIGCLIFTLIYTLNLLFDKRLIVYKLILIIGFILFFILYIQGNWLVGNLPVLTGDEIIWDNYGRLENVLFISALVFIIFLTIVSIKKIKFWSTIKYATIGTLFVGVILLVSIISTLVLQDALKEKDGFNANTDNFNMISTNKNFLIFLVDTTDSYVFNEVLKNDDDFDGLFDDFTYYTDAMGYYMHTRDSIPLILSGYINRNEKDFSEFCKDAYNNSILFEALEKNGYRLNLYTRSVIWEGERKYDIDNSSSIYDLNMNIQEFANQEWKYILFKYLPYSLKEVSGIENLDFYKCLDASPQTEAYSGDINNLLVYPKIIYNDTLEKIDSNYFQFVHIEGAHPPFNQDKNVTPIDNGTYEQKIAASLTMIQAYIDRLKANDVYDNSVIVVMADHGYHAEGFPEELGEYGLLVRCNPIVLIKGFNEKHEMIESDIPISFADLQNAFKELISGTLSTELFSNIEYGRTRNMLWLIWGQEDHMVEFETDGMAREYEKFTPTGVIYDLKK